MSLALQLAFKKHNHLIKHSFYDLLIITGNMWQNSWKTFFTVCKFLLRLPVGRGGVINSPRFCFFFFFPCRKSAHRSWVTPLCIVWATTLNSISSGICHQNTQFNMYTTTSKQQEGCTFEDSHPKCFITTNFTAKLSRGAVIAVMYMFWERHIQRSIRIQLF